MDVPGGLPIISESEFTVLELNYYRSLHAHSWGRSDCYTMILQHLWDSYGNVFEDKSLRYAVLAFESLRRRNKESLEELRTMKTNCLTFLSKFHLALGHALRDNTATEPQLFALFFARCSISVVNSIDALHANGVYFPQHYTQLIGYEDGFLTVLDHLNRIRTNFELQTPRLSHLWGYTLSFLRRTVPAQVGSTQVGSMVQFNRPGKSCLTLLPRAYKMHVASQGIPDASGANDSRLKRFLLGAIANSEYPDWIGLYWNICEKFQTLRGVFQLAFVDVEPTESQRRRLLAGRAVRELQEQIEQIESLAAFIGMLRNVTLRGSQTLTLTCRNRDLTPIRHIFFWELPTLFPRSSHS